MTDLLAEIRARRLAAEEDRRERRDRMTEAAAAASKPKEAAARVAGWSHASMACRTLLWSLDWGRCTELCPQQVAPKHEAEFSAVARQVIAKLEALIAIAEARRAAVQPDA